VNVQCGAARRWQSATLRVRFHTIGLSRTQRRCTARPHSGEATDTPPTSCHCTEKTDRSPSALSPRCPIALYASMSICPILSMPVALQAHNKTATFSGVW
jgi:hypothetical protein